MAVAVSYKKPRRINSVSVILVAFLGLTAYFAYQYIPVFFRKQEAFRVLEETGSRIAGHSGLLAKESSERDKVQRKLEFDLRGLGISDPEMEVWVESDGDTTELGVIYTDAVEWPFDILKRREIEQELVHAFMR